MAQFSSCTTIFRLQF